MSEPERGPALDEFLGEPTRDIEAWRRLWEVDLPFPIRSHRGPVGRLLVVFKRLLRPFVKVPQNDLWERQRVFNLIVLDHLARAEQVEAALAEIDRLRWTTQELKDLSVFLTRFVRSGVDDIVGHNDALYARVDQKLDRYRRESQRLWAALAGALAAAEVATTPEAAAAPGDTAAGEPQRPARVLADSASAARGPRPMAALEQRFARYIEQLPAAGAVLDLACGEGEVLEILTRSGYAARGVDRRAAMVERCAAKGLEARRAEPAEALAAAPAGSLAAVVALDLLERLSPPEAVRVVRLAWLALAPGGSLVIETANPLSLVVGARDVWTEPGRLRPVHPEALTALLMAGGFEPVQRLELDPFPASERLPEISLDGLAGEARRLADGVNRLRDRLDALLFGSRICAVVGRKPGP